MTLARRHDLPETEGLAVALTIHLGLGDAAEREELLEQTLARRDWERWPEVYASLLHIRAWAAYGAGDYDDAVAWLERAAHLYEECGALLRRGAALNMLSHALIAAEEYARAEANLERTRALCEELPGARAIYSEYHNASGELRRQQGRYDEARHHYERLIELCMRSKSELNALIGSVNLLINALQARRYDDLAQLFATDLWRDWGGKTPATLRTKTALARAALALWRDEDTGIDEVLAEALEHQHVRGVFDTDVLIGCARVAELARQRGRDDLASRAEAIAQAHRDSFS